MKEFVPSWGWSLSEAFVLLVESHIPYDTLRLFGAWMVLILRCVFFLVTFLALTVHHYCMCCKWGTHPMWINTTMFFNSHYRLYIDSTPMLVLDSGWSRGWWCGRQCWHSMGEEFFFTYWRILILAFVEQHALPAHVAYIRPPYHDFVCNHYLICRNSYRSLEMLLLK
jgi:hypothetical protein